MRLYHHPISSSARRAVLAAIHLGAPVELVTLNLLDADDRKHLLGINPNNKVPVLVDGDFILWESCAIMQYLAERTPGQTVYPTEARARADVNRWLFWSSQHFSPAVGILGFENFIKEMIGAGAADPAEVRKGETLVAQVAGILDAHLADREWLSGAGLTLADFAIAATLMHNEAAKVPVAHYAHLQAWFGRVQALPAWRKTVP